MKSFGVRLAAGAGTILVVAYAIALAQKDTQAVSDSWNAETTVATGPAVPIASGDLDNWLQQPDSNINDEQTALLLGDRSGTVQQVDHSESGNLEPAIANAGFTSPTATASENQQTIVLATPEFPSPENSTVVAPLPLATGEPGFASSASETVADTAMALPEFTATGQPQPIPNSPTGFAATAADPAFGNPAFATPPAPVVAAIPVSTAGLDATTAGLSPATAGLGLPSSTLEDADIFESSGFNPEAAPQTFADTAPNPPNVLRSADPQQTQLRGLSPATAVAAAAGSIAEPATIIDAPQPLDGTSDVAHANDPNFAGGVQSLDVSPTPNPLVIYGDTVMVAPQATAQPGSRANFQTDQGAISSGTDPPSVTGISNLSESPVTMASSASEYSNQPTGMVRPNSAIALHPNATTDAPGERRLEGAQTPSVIIQKRAPAEVKVGKPASFVIHVRNVGAVEALDVEVHDRVPAGMRLVDASPTPQRQGNMLMWQIGSMPAGDERTITMQLIPEQEGELGSVARVSFEAAASVRTIATRPVLEISQQTPEKVLIGQQLEIGLTISNSGSGQATNVEIWEDVPDGLSHPEGPQLKHNLGTLAPGEVRTDSLFLKAEKAGIIRNTITLVGDDGLKTEDTVVVQVIAPDLQVSLEGPSRRFLERTASYQLNVANAGTADATNVEISVQLSRGFSFVSTDYEGQYDSNRHSVSWSLAQLPAGANGAVPLTLLPVEAGEQIIKIKADADLGIAANSERKMTVEGFADLGFSITNPKGPIEIGAETTYEITVNNRGSKPDTNVRLQVMISAGLELISVDGEAGTDGNGLVAFQPKPQLAPGQEFKYRLRVRGTTAGTHIVKAVVVSDHNAVPVTKEDSTRVYADQ